VTAALSPAGPGRHLGWNVHNLDVGADQYQSQRPPVATGTLHSYPSGTESANPTQRLGVTGRRVGEAPVIQGAAYLVDGATRQSVLMRVDPYNHHDPSILSYRAGIDQ